MKTALILEDVAETREWLARLLKSAFDGIWVDLAPNCATGIAAAASRDYDLALLDLMLPDGSGLDVLREMRRNGSAAKCIVTTVIADDSYIVAALAAGADGYLLKEQPEAVLIRQLRQISSGIPALSPSIAKRIMEHFRLTGPFDDDSPALTNREKDVLSLISRGLRNAEVATELGLTKSTVASYIKDIYRKLGISSHAEASWHASRMGLNQR
ncbi:MAG: response regulator transcription factor [Rhodobacterales bacterium]|nr:response regulator transcription factor [Rhodobacterales bacterium]